MWWDRQPLSSLQTSSVSSPALTMLDVSAWNTGSPKMEHPTG
ncbi:hypothetical protein JRI60_47250 [Archangium violaceum]|nr:hypothetical protein JRI60_47250 [Archangium violaceum]